MGPLAVILRILYYIVFPVIYLLQVTINVLSVAAAPLLYLGQFVLSAISLPLSIFPKLETMYIFVGTAVIVGAITGTSLHFASGFFASLLNLNDSSGTKDVGFNLYGSSKKDAGMEVSSENLVASGIEPKRQKISSSSNLEDWELFKQEYESGRNGKIPNTILEEDDSSEIDL